MNDDSINLTAGGADRGTSTASAPAGGEAVARAAPAWGTSTTAAGSVPAFSPAATTAAPGGPWGQPGGATDAGGGGTAATAQPQVAATPYAPPIRPVYDGTLAGLYVVYLKNLVLSLLTLGLYRFWARTRLRRYLWSHTSAFGDRFEYRGTGLEMFLGFLTGLGLLLVVAGIGIAAYSVSGDDNPLADVGLDNTLSLGFLVLGFPLLYVAQYGSLRYRLTRSAWRGISGHLEGSAWKFGALYTGLSIANTLCMNLLRPVLETRVAQYQLRNSRVGTAAVEFAGTPGDIYGRYIGYYFLNIAAWVAVGVLVSIGIGAFFADQIPDPMKFMEQVAALEPRALLLLAVGAVFIYILFSIMILPVRCWYQAFLVRYLVSRTRLAGMLFVTGVSTRQMWGYLVLNYLIILLTLGLGFPWVLHRTMRLITDQLWIYGAPDARQIQRTSADGSATGEGLLDLLSPGAV